MQYLENISTKNSYLLLVIISTLSGILFLHTDLNYNSDAIISSVALVISSTIAENPFKFHYLLPGFKANGGFTPYLHWPPLSYWLLAIWLKFVANSLLSARIFILIFKIASDLFLLKYLNSRNNKICQNIFISLIFCFIPFRMNYLDLIFGDSLVLFFIISTMYFYQKNNYILLTFSGIAGILCSWYFGIFVFGFTLFKLIQKDINKLTIILVCTTIFTLIAWVVYVFYAKNLVQTFHFQTNNTHNTTQNSFFNQFSSYSGLAILNGNFNISLATKWLAKFGVEVTLLTLCLSALPQSYRNTLNTYFQELTLGFISLFLVLPVFFMIHSHNIYFLSFSVSIFLASKTNLKSSYYVLLALPILTILISKFEFKNLETQQRDNWIIEQIEINKSKFVLINNPGSLSINYQRFCNQWWVIYNTETMLYERLGNYKSKLEFIQQTNVKRENTIIFSSVKLDSNFTLINSFKEIYCYKIEKSNF